MSRAYARRASSIVRPMADSQLSGRWTTLSPADREMFDAAIARHRRASWRVTAACAVAVAALALVVAIHMAPLLYCTIALLFDLVNIATPAPDLMGWLARQIDPLASGDDVSAATMIRLGAFAAVP